jgi:glucose-1-phosphate thymidylyltransferase
MHKALNLVGICPAAGHGKRLGPLPISKELFPIGFHYYTVNKETRLYPKPISQYLIESMVKANARKIFMVISSHKKSLIDFYKNGTQFGTQIAYIYQEIQTGMPFALDLAFNWIDENTITLFGMPDTLFEPRNAFSMLLETHLCNGSDVTLGLFKTNQPQKFGMVKLDTEQNALICIDKPKQTSLKYMWGIAVWNYKFSNFMHICLTDILAEKTNSEVVLSTIFNQAISDTTLKVQGYKFSEGYYIDIGTVQDLKRATLKAMQAD